MKERKAVVVAKIITHIGLIRTSSSSVIEKHFSVFKILKYASWSLAMNLSSVIGPYKNFLGRLQKRISQNNTLGNLTLHNFPPSIPNIHQVFSQAKVLP